MLILFEINEKKKSTRKPIILYYGGIHLPEEKPWSETPQIKTKTMYFDFIAWSLLSFPTRERFYLNNLEHERDVN